MRSLVVLVPAFLLVVGWSLSVLFVDSRSLPAPSAVVAAFLKQLVEGEFLAAVAQTATRAIISFIASALIGLLLGLFPPPGAARRGVDAVVTFLRGIPGPALLPLFMTAFGLFWGPKLALAIFVCALINAAYTSAGIREAESSRRAEMARTFGAGRSWIFLRVVLPSALERILSGWRITLALSLALSVLAEYVLLTGVGMGVLLRLSYEDRLVERMYALILWTGCLGLMFNSAFDWLERRIAWYKLEPIEGQPMLQTSDSG